MPDPLLPIYWMSGALGAAGGFLQRKGYPMFWLDNHLGDLVKMLLRLFRQG